MHEEREKNGISSCLNRHSNNPSADSAEFEKCMAELDRIRPVYHENQNISIDKSFGGWKSDYESECASADRVDQEEIKSAIQLLLKVGLLNPVKVNYLAQLSDALEANEAEKLESLLKTLGIKSEVSVNSLIYSEKLQDSWSQQRTEADELAVTTPKGNFNLSEDLKKDRILFSSNNLS